MRVPRLTIHQYGVGFIVAVLSVFSILGVFSYQRIIHFQDRIHNKQIERGHYEIEQHIQNLIVEVGKISQQIAEWDETHQQLRNAGFYDYWRSTRLPAQAIYADFVIATELYDHQRNALSALPGFGLPKRMDYRPGIFALQMQGRPVLVSVQAIILSANKSEVGGYLVMVVDLMRALLGKRMAPYVDMQSLSFSLQEGDPVPAVRLYERARFKLIRDENLERLVGAFMQSIMTVGALLFMTSAVFFLFIHQLVTRPIRSLSNHINNLRQGLSSSSNILHTPVIEIQNIYESLNNYRVELTQANLDLDDKNRELWNLAHHDALTRVYNRRAFDEDWRHIRETVAGRRIEISFLLFDCDRFKPLNDTYGHAIGDQVLVEVASCLEGALRAGDRLYRLGGDEFCTVLVECTPDGARVIAGRCLDKIAALDMQAIGVNEALGVSIGISNTTATDRDRLDELPKLADIAMYTAKRPGQNNVALYDSDMLEDSLTLFSSHITAVVFDAIANKRSLQIHYQAVSNLDTGRVEYYEALARIQDEDTLLYPSKILPVVEDRRIELEFDLAVIAQIHRDLQSGAIPTGTGVAINISGVSLVNPTMMEHLMALPQVAQGYQLSVEVTETSLITRLSQATTHLKQLQRAGFHTCLDDFGSGYSSLRYLTDMPVDVVKFDMGLVQSLEANAQSSGIVRALANMIRDAGYKTVAEGVESEALLNIVGDAGFSHAQGYYLHRPQALPLASGVTRGRLLSVP